MTPAWFKPRGYKHLDAPVGERFAIKSSNPDFVKSHDWLPLIHYIKRDKRYKPLEGRTVYKDRPIRYASHRDACILSRYAQELDVALNTFYDQNDLGEHVVAYRKLGKSNYDFSAAAYRFSMANAPCMVLCFDITGFFDHLNHGILKSRLKRVLGVKGLSDDWHKVFRNVTNFKQIFRADLAAHPIFGPRLKSRDCDIISTISVVKAEGLQIKVNANDYSIPQGTPISSSFSNLYMIEVDSIMSSLCNERGGLYQRYSDDILLVCKVNDAAEIEAALQTVISEHRLELKEEKSDRVAFNAEHPKAFQYLGFNISPDGVTIRPGSLSRQWRRAKRSIAKIKKIGEAAIAAGTAKKIYTKKLRKKLSPVGVRNFSAYARRSAKVFGSKKIVQQVCRLERMADQAIRDLKE